MSVVQVGPIVQVGATGSGIRGSGWLCGVGLVGQGQGLDPSVTLPGPKHGHPVSPCSVPSTGAPPLPGLHGHCSRSDHPVPGDHPAPHSRPLSGIR